jgi:hypothetical protein
MKALKIKSDIDFRESDLSVSDRDSSLTEGLIEKTGKDVESHQPHEESYKISNQTVLAVTTAVFAVFVIAEMIGALVIYSLLFLRFCFSLFVQFNQ